MENKEKESCCNISSKEQKENEGSSKDEELFDRVCKKLLEMLKDV